MNGTGLGEHLRRQLDRMPFGSLCNNFVKFSSSFSDNAHFFLASIYGQVATLI